MSFFNIKKRYKDYIIRFSVFFFSVLLCGGYSPIFQIKLFNSNVDIGFAAAVIILTSLSYLFKSERMGVCFQDFKSFFTLSMAFFVTTLLFYSSALYFFSAIPLLAGIGFFIFSFSFLLGGVVSKISLGRLG